MRKAENYLLNFLTATPLIWISACFLLYLLEFNPRVFEGETLDEYFLLFLQYGIFTLVPLWFILMIYKGIAKHFTPKLFMTHLSVFIGGAVILVLMIEMNPYGWTGRYFD